MYPPIYEICSVDSNVQSNLGASPTRLHPFGEVSEGETLPYAVWQIINGSPENCISDVPDIDSWVIQVDIYASAGADAYDAAQAMRDAIEPYAHLTSFGPDGRDEKTKNYRYTFTVEWWDSRASSST